MATVTAKDPVLAFVLIWSFVLRKDDQRSLSRHQRKERDVHEQTSTGGCDDASVEIVCTKGRP